MQTKIFMNKNPEGKYDMDIMINNAQDIPQLLDELERAVGDIRMGKKRARELNERKTG